MSNPFALNPLSQGYMADAADNQAGSCHGLLGLRLLLAWAFCESGVEKFNRGNGFSRIQDAFFFPFTKILEDLSWSIFTWFELPGPIARVINEGAGIPVTQTSSDSEGFSPVLPFVLSEPSPVCLKLSGSALLSDQV